MKHSQHRATKKFGSRVAASGKFDAAPFGSASRRAQAVRTAEASVTSRMNKKSASSRNSLMVIPNRPSANVQRKAQNNFDRAVNKRLSAWASSTYAAASKVASRGANYMSTTNVRSGGALSRGYANASPPAASSGSTGVSSAGSSSSGTPVGGGVDCSATESCAGALGSELSSSDSDAAVPSHRSRHDHDR